MVNNGDVHIEKPSDSLVAVFLMFGLCSHIRRVQLKAALHRMVSVMTSKYRESDKSR